MATATARPMNMNAAVTGLIPRSVSSGAASLSTASSGATRTTCRSRSSAPPPGAVLRATGMASLLIA